MQTDSDMDHTKYIMQTVVSQNRCLELKKKRLTASKLYQKASKKIAAPDQNFKGSLGR